MNSKKSALLFLDIAIGSGQDQNEIGRIFIEPARHTTANNFVQIFGGVAKGFVERGRLVNTLGKLSEARRNAYVKFTFDTENINRVTEGQGGLNFDCLNHEDASLEASTTLSGEPNGLVIMSSDTTLPCFYILTSSWSAQDVPGDVVGSIFKGMELVQHVSWFGSDTDYKVNETCLITDMGVVPPEHDLGVKQRDSLLDPFPDLPGDSDLDYRDFERVLNVSFKIKASGSLLFRQERYQMARFRFGKAVRYLSWATERQKITLEQEFRALQIIVPCILNSAACRLKLRDFEGALEDCNEAMELCPNNPKAYFRRGQAYHGKINYEQSLCDLYTALKLAPNDRAIKNEIAAVEGEMQVYKKMPSRRNSEDTAMQVK